MWIRSMVAAGLVAASAPAWAGDCADAGIARKALDELWDWVRAEVGQASVVPAPEVCLVPEEVLLRLRGGGEAQAMQLEALYDRTRTRILVRERWRPADPVSSSVIVHELVHHAQSVSGTRFACPALAEKDAYRVQETWLERSGLSLESSFGVDGFTLLILTNCDI